MKEDIISTTFQENLPEDLYNILELEEIYTESISDVDTFLNRKPELIKDKLIDLFIRSYECIGIYIDENGLRFNLGIYGMNMIHELISPEVLENEFLEYSSYIISKNDISISISFYFNLSNERMAGIYFNYAVFNNSQIIKETSIEYFCETFPDFILKICFWLKNKTNIEEMVKFLANK